MSPYKSLILHELAKIEQEENVQILFACESGSRAWGFPSLDSDYDVRFVYVRPVEWYLSIDDRRDVIERPIHNMLDINGWDLRKALQLFRKSNPPLLEWLQSPISYMEKYSIAEQLRSLSSFTYSPKSCMYHYLNMAKGNERDYLRAEQVRVKKYFYVLRPILACEWLRKYDSTPPMEFAKLVETLIPQDSELYQVILELLARKREGEELDVEPRIPVIHTYVQEKLSHLESLAALLTHGRDATEELNTLFRSALHEVWSTPIRWNK
ncbi:nucleotidyltransferase domain-containing protein [Brevibacillus centrosporus]|uniref:nucleotidyltransferase domain-containing protein n=1 Tax=Brevibacillus centrosporus TaxID=54910 RepID=UPI003985FA60